MIGERPQGHSPIDSTQGGGLALAAVPRPVLRPALVVKLTGGGLRVPLVVVAVRPLGAVATPVPRVRAFESPVDHGSSSLALFRLGRMPRRPPCSPWSIAENKIESKT